MSKTKRVGYKTLRQFYKILKNQNKICKKSGLRLKFTIELPLKHQTAGLDIVRKLSTIVRFLRTNVLTFERTRKMLSNRKSDCPKGRAPGVNRVFVVVLQPGVDTEVCIFRDKAEAKNFLKNEEPDYWEEILTDDCRWKRLK